jgi:hypothetical protein
MGGGPFWPLAFTQVSGDGQSMSFTTSGVATCSVAGTFTQVGTSNVFDVSMTFSGACEFPTGTSFSGLGFESGDGRLSQINLTKFTQHLLAVLDAVKAANLSIDAFEIGNEFDTTCYDADVPVGHQASKQEIETWLRGYGEFPKAAALVIRDANYFPHSKIITFGMAHASDKWDKPWRHMSHPEALVARLRNVNRFNCLDNSQYHVDGYGTRIYPWPGDIVGSVRGALTQDADELGRGKPLWVTEWGFLSKSSFPTPNHESLDQGIQEIIDTFASLAPSIPLGPMMFYRYDVWLTDETGQLLPQASILSRYGAEH